MSKHHRKNTRMNNGFNLMDLLGNIDISQLMSLISSMGGIGGGQNMSQNDLGSMLNNLNMGNSTSQGGFDESNLKSQLSALENRLSHLENRSQMEEQILNKVRELQNSPDSAKLLNDFMKSNSKNRGHR